MRNSKPTPRKKKNSSAPPAKNLKYFPPAPEPEIQRLVEFASRLIHARLWPTLDAWDRKQLRDKCIAAGADQLIAELRNPPHA